MKDYTIEKRIEGDVEIVEIIHNEKNADKKLKKKKYE